MLTLPNCYAKEMCDWYHVLDKYYPCHEKYELVRMKNVPQYKWYLPKLPFLNVDCTYVSLFTMTQFEIGWVATGRAANTVGQISDAT